VENADHAIEAYHKLRPSLVLFGPCRTTRRQIETIERFIGAAPDARTVVSLLNDNEEKVAEMFRIGVAGVVGKRTSLEAFLRSLVLVAEGGVYSEYPIDDLVRHFDGQASPEGLKLTPHENRVLRLIRDGESSKEIATELGLSVETIRYYRKSIMRKLKVHNVAELLQVANMLQLIPTAAVSEHS